MPDTTANRLLDAFSSNVSWLHNAFLRGAAVEDETIERYRSNYINAVRQTIDDLAAGKVPATPRVDASGLARALYAGKANDWLTMASLRHIYETYADITQQPMYKDPSLFASERTR